MFFFAYFIPLVLIFLGFKYKSSKPVSWLFMIYIWILMGLNVEGADYENYEIDYNQALVDIVWDSSNTEWGYKGLNVVFNLLGFTYQEFRMFYGAIFAIIIVSATQRLGNYPNFVLSFFLIWPMLPSVSGQRQTMANGIVCWAIPFLFEGIKHGKVKYVITILLAASIHNSTLFYLILLFAKRTISSSQIRIISFITIVLFLLVHSSTLLVGVGTGFDNYRVGKYLDSSLEAGGTMSDITRIAYILLLIMTIWIVNRQSNILIGYYQNITDNNDQKVDRIILFRNSFIFLLLTIPGYAVSAIYQRLLYGVLLVGYTLFAEYKEVPCMRKKEKQKYSLCFILIIMLLLSSYVILNSDHHVFAVLTDNMLFR